ncbi:MAG: Hsp70 family protein [Clostridium sp.]
MIAAWKRLNSHRQGQQTLNPDECVAIGAAIQGGSGNDAGAGTSFFWM